MSYRFEHYGVNEGLSQGNVTTVMRDKMGLMWFGTWDGVTVYDGFKNKIYREQSKDSTSLKGTLVNSIIETNKGQIFVATSHCLNLFNPYLHNFSHFNIDNKPSDVRIIEEENSTLILSINNKLWSFNCDTKQFSIIKSELSDLWDLYFSTTTKAVNHAEGLYSHIYHCLKLKKFSLLNHLSFIATNTINDIIILQDAVCFATDKGVFVLNIPSQSVRPIVTDIKAKSLVQYNNKLYIGSQSNGVLIYDVSNNNFEQSLHVDERNKYSLSGNFVRTMYIDREQNLWVSSLGNGINYCNLSKPIAHTILTKYDTILLTKQDHYIKNIVEDKDGILWIISVTGNMYLFDSSYQLIRTITPHQVNSVYKPNSYQQCFLTPLNQLFFLSENGMYQYAKDHQFKRIEGAGLNQSQLYLSGMCMESDSTAIVATRQGLLQFTNDDHSTLKPLKGLNYSNVILSTYVDRHKHLFVNPMFSGIDIYSIKPNSNERIKTIHLGCNAKHYVEEQDTLWIATTKGIIKLNLINLEYYVFDEADGLPNQYIYCLLRDDQLPNTFWMSSNKGIFRYNVYTKELFTLGLRDGLASLEYNTNSFTKRRNGDVVFGSIDGFTFFNPDSISISNQVNQLVSFDFKLNNNYVEYTSFFQSDSSYKIPYLLNTISFRLMQVLYPNTDIPIYYILEGYDKTWALASNPVEVRYSNLKEGDYTFKTKFLDRNKGYVYQTHYTFTILAPWYRSWWAYIIYSLLSLLIVVGFVQQYFKRKLNIEREELRKQQMILDERNRISADLHDDIGATLSSMYLYSDMANEMMESRPAKSKEMIQKIVTQSKELMQQMGDIIWSMKQADDQKYTLSVKIVQYSNELLSPKNILLNMEIEPGIDFYMNHPLYRKNVLLIIKEAFNNSAKYSHASVLTLSIKNINNTICLRMLDNGVGFDSSISKTGNGLKNIEFRTSQLGGHCTITSIVHQGICIECCFPIATISHTNQKKF